MPINPPTICALILGVTLLGSVNQLPARAVGANQSCELLAAPDFSEDGETVGVSFPRLARNAEAALAACREMAQRHPHDGDVLFMLGRSFAASDRIDEARIQYELAARYGSREAQYAIAAEESLQADPETHRAGIARLHALSQAGYVPATISYLSHLMAIEERKQELTEICASLSSVARVDGALAKGIAGNCEYKIFESFGENDNLEAALAWWGLAARAGNGDASAKLVLYHEKTLKTSGNISRLDEAAQVYFNILETADYFDRDDNQFRRGVAYIRGMGVAPDKGRGIELLTESASLGYEPAILALTSLARFSLGYSKPSMMILGPNYSSDLDKHFPESGWEPWAALEWLQERVQIADPDATALLGFIYFEGTDRIAQDRDKGISLLNTAAALGNADARAVVGSLQHE